nr:unnamed protein product [Callosobruchus chinensis]
MKPVTQKLRSLGIVTIIYLDDLLIMADSYKNAEDSIKTALKLLRSQLSLTKKFSPGLHLYEFSADNGRLQLKPPLPYVLVLPRRFSFIRYWRQDTATLISLLPSLLCFPQLSAKPLLFHGTCVILFVKIPQEPRLHQELAHHIEKANEAQRSTY